MYQTDELKNLDAADTGLRSALTKTLKLRSWLYGEAFRGFVRAVTGCGELTSQVRWPRPRARPPARAPRPAR